MNGKCYCGAPNCIGTLFPRIIRDGRESGDEGANEAEVYGGDERSEVEQKNEEGEGGGGKGDGVADEMREASDGGEIHMDL